MSVGTICVRLALIPRLSPVCSDCVVCEVLENAWPRCSEPFRERFRNFSGTNFILYVLFQYLWISGVYLTCIGSTSEAFCGRGALSTIMACIWWISTCNWSFFSFVDNDGFGEILQLFVFDGRWPCPKCGPVNLLIIM